MEENVNINIDSGQLSEFSIYLTIIQESLLQIQNSTNEIVNSMTPDFWDAFGNASIKYHIVHLYPERIVPHRCRGAQGRGSARLNCCLGHLWPENLIFSKKNSTVKEEIKIKEKLHMCAALERKLF